MTLVKRTNNDWLPSMLNDMFQTDWLGGTPEMNFNSETNVPAVNIQDKDDNYVVELAAPGKKKEDFKLELDNEILSISSEEKQESTSGEENFTRKEFSYTAFQRKFTLPETVDNAKISASYEDGILRIEIPKKEEAKPAPKRLIDIS